MSKTVKYQVPFQSLKGVNYRVDIYAEGYDGDPIQLKAGETPFSIDEDGDDDFFAPVRTQTGTLQILDPDGSLMEDLIPDTNIESPVRLINVDTSAVEFQGFLSCEAYSQSYTDNVQIIEVNVNSMLAAMENVYFEKAMAGQMMQTRLVIGKAMKAAVPTIESWYRYVYYPAKSRMIMLKGIYLSAFFNATEVTNGETVYHKYRSTSIKEILGTICTFMGWVLREDGQDLYFIDPSDTGSLWRETFIQMQTWNNAWPHATIEQSEIEMSGLEWRGDDHKKSISQGACAVKVTAQLKDFSLDITLPEMPLTDVTSIQRAFVYSDPTYKYVYALLNNEDDHDSLCEYYYYTIQQVYNTQVTTRTGTSTQSDVMTNSILYAGADSIAYKTWHTSPVDKTYTANVGAFMARIELYNKSSQTAFTNFSDGLYLIGINKVNSSVTITNDEPVFEITSPLSCIFDTGYININMVVNFFLSSVDDIIKIDGYERGMYLSLKFGDYYWNGSAWTTTKSYFCVQIKSSGAIESNYTKKMKVSTTNGYFIPITESMNGLITLGLYPDIVGNITSPTAGDFEAFITTLDVSYCKPKDIELTDRSKNSYYKETGSAFSEEQEITTDLASMMQNEPSPSLVMTDSETAMETLNYYDGDTIISMRPEVNLLNRMNDFYKDKRRTLELTTAVQTDTPEPLIRLRGFDGRLYTPVAVSHDYGEDTSVITAIETPEEEDE